ncbi:MAG: DUF3581 family protein [Pseudomonadota bacterium]
MNLNTYINNEQGKFFCSQQQASDFAKNVAGDFNPIHNVDAKKFIVPGDLLFSLILQQSGLSQKMKFNFSGMVRDNTKLHFTNVSDTKLALVDDNAKEYVSCEFSGEVTKDQQIISLFAREYVSFSAMAFPHLLVPLMHKEQVMINIDRPLIIYESMSVELEHLDFDDLQLNLHDSSLDVNGKRGRVCLQFDLMSADQKIGCGKKYMLLTGLREYEQQQIDNMVAVYNKAISEH